jgi:ABC-type sugar transport system ATPase subunit
MYQDLALVGTFDLGGNFFLGRELTRSFLGGLIRLLDKKRMRTEALAVLRSDVGIEIGNPFSPTIVLSGGQRQAIAIGRAVHAQARMIIMDEPTAALGVEETERVMMIIESLRSRGLAVLLVSHNLEHVFRVTDRIAVMHQGVVSAICHRDEVTRAQVVALVMGADLAAIT